MSMKGKKNKLDSKHQAFHLLLYVCFTGFTYWLQRNNKRNSSFSSYSVVSVVRWGVALFMTRRNSGITLCFKLNRLPVVSILIRRCVEGIKKYYILRSEINIVDPLKFADNSVMLWTFLFAAFYKIYLFLYLQEKQGLITYSILNKETNISPSYVTLGKIIIHHRLQFLFCKIRMVDISSKILCYEDNP